MCCDSWCLQIYSQLVTLVCIEVKCKAGTSEDALQQGMAYHLKDHAAEAFMATWQTPRLAPLITVMQAGHCHGSGAVYVKTLIHCRRGSDIYVCLHTAEVRNTPLCNKSSNLSQPQQVRILSSLH